jgi:2,5-diketo-D-gluconate reductase B
MTPTIIANGAEIPVMGFGTWELRGQTALHAVEEALDVGYRHIDTAVMYGNETEVGEAIRSRATSREEIFITTKVWPDDAGDGPFQRSAAASLKRLQVDQVDLLLIHWPSSSVPMKEQIFTLCDAKRRGYARHIGISNFSADLVEQAVRFADEPIVTNQIEHHPWRDQSATFKACAKHGISITSYSPIAKARRLNDPTIVEIARAHGKTPAQVVLRWQIQLPMNIAIPRTSKPARIAENFDIFGFSLTAEEMRRISSLTR